LDRRLANHSVCGGTARPEASEFFIGSRRYGQESIEATVDELRISDIPRLGSTEGCERILVADSANHRVQAFDSQGNWITAYGSFGSGAGGFNRPQGLAVSPGGQVIVADEGNNRLVVLGFDGQQFTHQRSFRAGFNGPTGVTNDAQGRIYVADAGNNRVVVLSADGALLAQFGEPNDGYAGPFNAPRSLALEANGDIVVADTGNRRVVSIRDPLLPEKVYLPVIRTANPAAGEIP
jgi:sugar lactone lactonase YvrE